MMTKKKRETIVMIIHSLKCIFLKHLVDEIVAEQHIDTHIPKPNAMQAMHVR